MAETNPRLTRLTEHQRELVASWLAEFQHSWDESRLASQVDELPPAPSPLRQPALVEMVKVDLERQWQNGKRPTLSQYLAAFPELSADGTPPAELLQAEEKVRQQFGEPADPEATRLHQGTPFVPIDPPLELPERFGRYRILRRLGKGGMGAVFLAHDTELDRPVALKVPHLAAMDDPRVVQRFVREARAVAALEHPGVCAIYDVGRVGDLPYLTMAYIDGQALSERIAREGPLPEREAAALISELARALAYAHKQGVVHRDLKPSNVMINREGRPILMDFGLARRDSSEDVRLTASGAVFGSPAYMAPEQAEGKTGELGPPCDIYGLSVIMYEALTGKVPFTGRRESLIVQVARDEPPPPSRHRPDLDRRLEAICLKGMAKRIADRYASMDELAGALADFLKPPASAVARRPWPWVVGAVLGLVATGLWMFGPWQQTPMHSASLAQGTQAENRSKGLSPKLDDLLADLKSPDVIKRAAAAHALGQLSLDGDAQQRVVAALVQRVQDNLWESSDKKPDPSKEAALAALEKQASGRRNEALNGAAQSPNKEVAGWARIKMTVKPGIK